jgi:hypothetical protein
MGCDSYYKFNSFNLGNFWGGNAVIYVPLCGWIVYIYPEVIKIHHRVENNVGVFSIIGVN